MIDQATIDRIMDAAQIVDVVSEFVTLRKRGVNYVGLCPFHSEKTPSFSVSPSKGVCKCFSCGKGGNVVHFIMEHEQLSYYEALKWLAHKYNIEVKERELTDEEKHAQSIRESMFVVNEYARDYFQNILRSHVEGQTVGMTYFRQRGFRDDIITKFQLGYCLNQHDAFAREATLKGYRPEYLVKTGLCYARDDGSLRDRFWGRVIFPVHTLSGKVVAFGGRVLKTDAKTAKYVNSPESEIYHKSNELYGIYFAKQSIVKQDRCFLVEGYTDVISMHQSGIENVVASSGTSLTPGQIRLIHRFTNNITVLYDGDMAGIKASLRGIDMLLEEGMNIKVVLLPDGDDPDSFARKHNATDYQAYINAHEVDFIRFKTNLLLDDAGNDPIKRAGLITDIVRSISVIPDAIVRSVYIKECSQLLQVEEKLLIAEVGKLKEAQLEKEYKAQRNAQIQAQRAAGEQGASPSAEGTAAPEGEPGEAAPAIPVPGEPVVPSPVSDTYESYIPQDNPESRKFYPLEKLIMELLVRYGERVMCVTTDEEGNEAPLTVTEFIAGNLQIDDLQFHNPLHRQMLAEAVSHIHDEGFRAEHYFGTHPNPDISRYAVNLANERYTLSKYHTKSQKIVTDEERLYELVPHVMTDFKHAIVEEELKHTQQALLDPENMHDESRYLSIMKHYKDLSEVQRIMAKRLGDRVLNV
ncbi:MULTISPECIES: DNA primase [Mediterranea]|uniref:DNA primase n=1 Tax=Mediterranea TaxID=1926659 RepID=UPI00033EB536|nr:MULTISPECIES: DNA primase [Mediterranea]MCL1607232.1 DNA primase [Mediterranea sp. ET5]MDM8121630.1 DNA primase [Mediterranea massiliensis]MDM8199136.1 DNA primase [Mediterranea massiliensis]CDD82952.1 dNA primase [Bacteroides sp. CAG:462]